MYAIPTKDESPAGFHQKYIITKVDGKPIDPGAVYFALRLDFGGDDITHIRACREALWTYITTTTGTHLSALASSLIRMLDETRKDAGVTCRDRPTELLMPLTEGAAAFTEIMADLRKWSDATFGTPEERGPLGPLKHLKEEVEEAIANPTDKFEYVDMLFTLLDSANRAGLSSDDLMIAAREKLEVCKSRTYPKPPPGSDEVTNHDRTGE